MGLQPDATSSTREKMDHLAKRTQADHQPHLPVFNSLPRTDVTSEWQNKDANPDLLKLLS